MPQQSSLLANSACQTFRWSEASFGLDCMSRAVGGRGCRKVCMYFGFVFIWFRCSLSCRFDSFCGEFHNFLWRLFTVYFQSSNKTARIHISVMAELFQLILDLISLTPNSRVIYTVINETQLLPSWPSDNSKSFSVRLTVKFQHFCLRNFDLF